MGDDIEFNHDGIAPGSEKFYSGGVALPINLAILEITGAPQQTCEVREGDEAARMRISLERGHRHLRARFAACNGSLYSSAYYVYVRKIDDQGTN